MASSLTRRVPLRWRQRVFALTPAPLWSAARSVLDGETAAQQRAQAALASARTHRLRARLDAASPPLRTVPTRDDGVLLTAVVVTDPRFQSAVEENLDLVARALDDAGVPWVVTAAGTGRATRVAVPVSARAAALAAFEALGASRPVRVEVRTGAGPTGKPRLVRLRPGAEPKVVVVAEPRATADGALVVGRAAGCTVSFWDDGDGTPDADWTAPTRGDRTDELAPQDRTAATMLVAGVERPTFPAFTGHHLFDVTFPIDVVYTWVDGSDPEWLRRKDETLIAAGMPGVGPTLHELATNDSRFTSHDELRYSLRSLESYADWVRRIYVVTDQQVPEWLLADHPRIRVVDHTELFGGTGRLPTFNSHAIESRLHRIEDLAEHYLYLNDDIFFGRPVTPEDFFTGSGLSRFMISRALIGSGPVRPTDAPVTSAAKNNRTFLQQRFGRTVTNKFKHVPQSQRKSVMAELVADVGEPVERTASAPFRSPTDLSLPSSLIHHYAFATGRAVPGDLRYFYSDIGEPQMESRLRRLARNRDYDAFCLNDHGAVVTGVASRDDLLGRFLREYFPLPSSFERPDVG